VEQLEGNIKFMKKIIFTIFILLLVSSVSRAQFSDDEKDILELQDTRNLGSDDKLLKYLDSDSRKTVIRTLYALANISDTNTVEQIYYTLIGHKRNDVRSAAAFALGQIPSERTSAFLLTALSLNKNSDVVAEIYNALGKTGNEKALDQVSRLSFNMNDNKLKEAAALSIARFGIRKIKNENGLNALITLSNSNPGSELSKLIAYGFYRIGDKSLLVKARQKIYDLTKSSEPEARMWAYLALGKLQERSGVSYLMDSFDSENDWRVKVNMIASLNNYKLDSIPELSGSLNTFLTKASSDNNEHISLNAIDFEGKLFATADSNNVYRSDVRKMLENVLSDNRFSWRQKGKAAASLSVIFKDSSRASLFRAFSGTQDFKLKAELIKAFGNFNNGIIYREVRDSISEEVQRYNLIHPNTTGELIQSKDLAMLYRSFVEMLLDLDDKVDSDNRNIIRLMYSEFAGSRDPYLVDLSLTGLMDSLYINKRSETAQIMLMDYNDLQYPKDFDVMMTYVNAFGDMKISGAEQIIKKNLEGKNAELVKNSALALHKITGRAYEPSIRYNNDFNWDFIDSSFNSQKITFNTSRGKITAELYPEFAPFTVQKFLRLARSGAYDNTPWHRVVSNFVIQGGDITEGNYTGERYIIRSEFSPLSFRRGMLGVASSGKDTEESQFFIMHAHHPHLDGKYTIFGKVLEGMEVADKIQVGDIVESIKIERK
jgi:peptidylprolyl isomerase